MNILQSDLNDFTGSARLFPLPDFVMFPHVKKAFHLFEPRYRQLAADTLASDNFILLVQLAEGWESCYDERPPVQPIGCLTRIEHHQTLPDGRCNILVRGVCRVRMERELLTSKPYRIFEGSPLLDPAGFDLPEIKQEIGRRMLAWFGAGGAALAQFQALVESQLPVGNLCDILGFFLPLMPMQKQQLLAESNVARRAQLLLAYLAEPPPAPAAEEVPPPRAPRQPPDFSLN